MPSSPELSDTFCDKRIVEVFKKIKTEDLSKTDGHIRVSAEIKIDLKGKCDDAQPACGNRELPLGNEPDFLP